MEGNKGLVELGWFGEMPSRQEGMTRESDDARWLREMVTDYRLDADNTVASRRIAINELIHSQRETITRLQQELIGKERAGTILVEKIAELKARLTAIEAAKKWTPEKPTVPGWYFYRRNGAVDVCRVAQFDIDENTFRHSRPCEWQGPFHPHEGPLTPGE